MEEKHNKMSNLFLGLSMDHFCILDKLCRCFYLSQRNFK